MKTQNYGGVHIRIPRTYSSEVLDRKAEGLVSCAADVRTHFLPQLCLYSTILISSLPLCFLITIFLLSPGANAGIYSPRVSQHLAHATTRCPRGCQ